MVLLALGPLGPGMGRMEDSLETCREEWWYLLGGKMLSAVVSTAESQALGPADDTRRPCELEKRKLRPRGKTGTSGLGLREARLEWYILSWHFKFRKWFSVDISWCRQLCKLVKYIIAGVTPIVIAVQWLHYRSVVLTDPAGSIKLLYYMHCLWNIRAV